MNACLPDSHPLVAWQTWKNQSQVMASNGWYRQSQVVRLGLNQMANVVGSSSRLLVLLVITATKQKIKHSC